MDRKFRQMARKVLETSSRLFFASVQLRPSPCFLLVVKGGGGGKKRMKTLLLFSLLYTAENDIALSLKKKKK